MRTRFAALCMLAGCGGMAVGQAASAPAAAPAGVAVNQRAVRLDVVVTDSAGKVVPGLTAQDFTILDNKQPLKPAGFEARQQGATPDTSVAVMLVLDNYNDALQSIARERQDMMKFLAQNGGRLSVPMSLTLFGNSGVKSTNLTLNGTALASYLEKSQPEVMAMGSAAGAYGAMDRGARSLQVLADLADGPIGRRAGRKLLIWIGEGWPIVTNPVLMENRTKKQQDATFAEIVAVNSLLRQNNITFYVANATHTGDASQDSIIRAYLDGVPEQKKALPGSLLPAVLAVQSGGLLLQVLNDLKDDLNQCVQDLSAYYTLSYEIPPAGHADELHTVSVTVNKPGLAVRSRTVYYAQP